VLLPENIKLQNKIIEIKNRIELLQPNAMETMDLDRLLQILNFAGLSGLEKLKRIGPSKATKILHERENGLFSSVRPYLLLIIKLIINNYIDL